MSARPQTVRTLTLSFDEYSTVLRALHHSAAQLRAYIRDTEQLAPEARRYPTDQPEMWRAQLTTVDALTQRLLELRPSTPTESPR